MVQAQSECGNGSALPSAFDGGLGLDADTDISSLTPTENFGDDPTAAVGKDDETTEFTNLSGVKKALLAFSHFWTPAAHAQSAPYQTFALIHFPISSDILPPTASKFFLTVPARKAANYPSAQNSTFYLTVNRITPDTPGSAFNELAVTWNNWTTDFSEDSSGTYQQTAALPTARFTSGLYTSVTFDITTYVRRVLNGTIPNDGFVLKGVAISDTTASGTPFGVQFNTRESSNNQKPYVSYLLDVRDDNPTDNPSDTPTAGDTPTPTPSDTSSPGGPEDLVSPDPEFTDGLNP